MADLSYQGQINIPHSATLYYLRSNSNYVSVNINSTILTGNGTMGYSLWNIVPSLSPPFYIEQYLSSPLINQNYF
jgi:hypothetical protein